MFPFKSALNASTLFPYHLDLKEQIKVAAGAGYDGFELWLRDLDAYQAGGGTLASLRQYVADCGIALPNAIAFFKWADADRGVRKQGLEQAKREMAMLAEIGCSAVAAPPFGDVEPVTPSELAEYYAQLVELGRTIGVEPYLEFWGRAKRLSTLEEALAVMKACGAAGTKALLDPFHMYTGGTSLESLAELAGERIGIVHANDYPLQPERAVIADKDRVFPGDGAAPLAELAASLHAAGYNGYLSLELFMDHYGDKPAAEAASIGLEKMKTAFGV